MNKQNPLAGVDLVDPTTIKKASDLTNKEAELIKKTLGVAMTREDLVVFLHLANKVDLDPFAKQIYAVPFDTTERTADNREIKITRYQTVISIDGLRTIAIRTGEYEGQTTPLYYSKNLNEWTEVWIPTEEEKYPHACKLGVYRKGFRDAVYAVAHWEEYVKLTRNGQITKFWANRSTGMLSKCAEALAMRKTFPNDVAGLYVEEEIDRKLVEVEKVEESKLEPEKVTTIEYAIDEETGEVEIKEQSEVEKQLEMDEEK